jgi:HK97 family phage major capsid protein
MPNLKKLNEKRAAAYTKIDELRKVMASEERDLNADEESAWNDANAEYDSIESQIAREQRAAELESQQVDNSAQRQIVTPDQRGESSKMDNARASRLAVNAWFRSQSGHESLEVTEEQKRACQQVNFNLVGNQRKFNLGDAPHTVSEARDQSAQIGVDGGFTCPQGFINNIEVALLQYAALREDATIMRTPDGNKLPWPTCNDTTNEGSWVGENATITAATDVAFGDIVFDAHKVSSLVLKVPIELIQDSAFDILGFVSARAGERIGRTMAEGYTTGDGVSKPSGIVTDATSGVTAAAVDAITSDEVIDLFHSVDPSYRGSAKFMFHDNVLAALRKLKDGEGQYIWQRGMSEGVPATLYGAPYTINQNMSSTITTGDKTMLYGDLSKYVIRDVGSVRVVILRELYAAADQVGVLVLMRTDGHLIDAGTNPVKYLVQL